MQKMDCEPEVVDKFFLMEKEENLFELTQNDMPVWDVFRMDIYLRYYWPELKRNESKQNKISFTALLRGGIGLIKSIIYLITVKSENLVIPCSRYRNENNEFYDKASLDVINSLNDKFIFETQSIFRKYQYQSANNYINFISRFIVVKDNLSILNFEKINNALIKSFGESKVDYDYLNGLYRKFIKDYKYYKSFFKYKRDIKRVFFVQNGLQKGLMMATGERGITSFELQHGSFERDHLAYSYPDTDGLIKKTYNANYLLTFGEYWGSYFNLISTIIPIGNNSFNLKCDIIKDDFILIISSVIHGEELSKLSLEISKQYPEKRLIFKLHSNEYSLLSKYVSLFGNASNIEIITNELSINELISQSELIILINSTVLYEALNLNRKVAIYKRVNYFGLNNIFKHSNVFLFDRLDELDLILNQKTDLDTMKFFRKFDTEKFDSFI